MGGAKKLLKKATSVVTAPARNIVGGVVNGNVRQIAGGVLGGVAAKQGGALGAVGADKLGLYNVPGDQTIKMQPDQDALTGAAAQGLSPIERQSGIIAPKYESLRDANGNLKSQFAYDPTKSDAFNALKTQAMSAPGESPWAKVQMQQQGIEQANLADQAAKQNATANAQAMSGLARFGGLSAGARTSLARQGMHDAGLAQQGVANQGMLSRLGITNEDINRNQNLLGNISSTELQGQGQNIGTLQGDVQGKQAFDLAKYQQQMAAYGANKTANAQVQSAKSSSKK